MDLNQRKLTKSEWNSTEIPVKENEKEILNTIIQGFHNVNIKHNKNCSLFGFLKMEYSETLEDYLYNKYFSEKIHVLKETYKAYGEIMEVKVKSNVTIKKVDSIRIEHNDSGKIKISDAFEYLLMDLMENILKEKTKRRSQWLVHYFTLYKLMRVNILQINKHIKDMVTKLLNRLEEEINMTEVIENAVEFIEKNDLLLKYADMTLYDHQKRLFTVVKHPDPKLVLYIAPTGTGKTLSPIGLSEHSPIIFVCAARHVGLALAKSAISVGKKIAVAFGCASSEDIRLHYFAAKDYSINKRSGGIGKVDNTNGEKVEIMICDIKSYLPAMYYMLAFNEANNLAVYWDEPTITMDYESHDLHSIIQKNWLENQIPNMILSSATLPKLHELTDTIHHFKEKFPGAVVYNIVSHDCKKTIPLINKNGYVVLPHYLSDERNKVNAIVQHCEENLTLMRYFDLNEVVQFILFVEKNNCIPENAKVSRNFGSIDDVNMQSIKLHYLSCIKKIFPESWDQVYVGLKSMRSRRISMNDSVDAKGLKIKKAVSIGPGVTYNTKTNQMEGQLLTRLASEQITSTPKHVATITATATSKSSADEQPGIYVTTKDAFTLTDGPTIFLANDVEKIAKFCIQQANIPSQVMSDIMEKIEFNNEINDRINLLEQELENLVLKNTLKDESKDTKMSGKKKTETRVKTMSSEDDRKNKKLEDDVNTLRGMIKTAQLNETFVPNKRLHINKWAEAMDCANVFTSDIEEKTIVDIMLLKDVSDSWKVLLMMGIGVFTNHPSIQYTEIMKQMADEQKLFMIIASSDYIYGTNYQFCHGYISKDISSTQEKIIQALGRIGRNNIQQNYSIRFRDDEQINKLFYHEDNKIEVRNMNKLFNVNVV